MIELAVIVVYFLAMLAIGMISKREIKKPADFFVTNRRSSTLLVTASLLATIIGGSATIGMAGLGFTRGLTGSWWLLSGVIGLVFLGVFFAKKVRRFALYTLPELIEKQYGKNMALAASVLIVVAWLGVIAAQIIAAGKIMSVLQIGSPALWMVLFSFVFIAYTAIGGQYSVIRTDLVQAALIIIGIFTGLAILLGRLGGWGGLQAALPPGQFDFPISGKFGAADLVSMLLIVGLTYVVGPDMYSRLFSARDERAARASALWTAALVIPVALAITLTGMGAAVLFPKITPEQAFPTIIREVFSPVIGSIVIAALISAVMSSADATLLSASTILAVDIFGRFRTGQKNVLSRSRWAVVLLGLLSLGIALKLNNVIGAMLFAYTIYTCGVILPVIAGFFKDRLKVTSAGAMAALLGGGAAGLASKIWTIKYLDLGALLLSLIVLFLVSFIDNAIRGRRLSHP